MKVKNFGFSLTSLVLLSSLTFASNIEQFFFENGYKKGYKDGYKQGYIKGYKQAKKDLETVLKAYIKDLHALEQGKYLDKEHYITYPRLYKVVKPDGSIEYKIVGCRIEKLRNLEDIIKNPWVVPTINQEEISNVKKASNRLITIPAMKNENPPQPKVYIVPLKTSNTKLLEQLGIPYEKSFEKGETIKAIFFDKNQMIEFCKKYNVCY
jgi:hypothetical protein